MADFFPQTLDPFPIDLGPTADPEVSPRRRLAGAVLLLAVREAKEGDERARHWLATARPGDTRPTSVCWWLSVAGFDPRHVDTLRRIALDPKRHGKMRKLRSPVRSTASR